MEFLKGILDSLRNEKGQTIIEYVLVIVLIAIVLVLAFTGGGIEQGVNEASNLIGSTIESGAGAL